MESESDQLRVKRRSAKGKFARQVRTVETMVVNTRSHSEVYVNWETLQRLYDDLQNRHEEFCETIDPKDDAAYEEEEAWMEKCRETYVKMSMTVNDYIRNMDSAKLCDNVNASGSDNVTKSHITVISDDRNTTPLESGTTQEMEKSLREPVLNQSESSRPSTFKLEFSQMPKFSGDVREYAVFRSDFKELIEPKCSKRDAITLLRNNLSGKAHLLIKGMGNDYDAAWDYLDSVYGDPRVVADAVTYDITSFSALDDDDDSRFCELCHLVRRSYNTLKDIGRQADLDNNHILAIIERKLSRDDRKVWSRKVEEGKSPATLQHLLNWMSIEMKTRMRTSALIREEPPPVNHVHYVSSRENYDNGPRTYSEMSYRCWICMSSTHWLDECERFRSMTPTERVNTVNKNNACLCCLKRTGINHTSKSCYRRRKCRERNGHNECEQYHHPLLHVATNASEVSCDAGLVGVAGMACSDVMLPVLEAFVSGGNRMRKLTNVLLDSGAQVSLIRIDLAEELRLIGKNVTITVNKVGGEEQTLKTKRYKLNVHSMNSENMVSLYAIGIPYITDDITSITNVSEKARQLKIATGDINRGGGPVGVLVGIDYPRLHTGETRTAGDVIARRSPLGWVIFGTDGQASSSNRVLTVQVSKSVDLMDCKKTVSMNVAPRELNRIETQVTDEQRVKVKKGSQCAMSYPRKLTSDVSGRAQAIERATDKKPRMVGVCDKVYPKPVVQMDDIKEEVSTYNRYHAAVKADSSNTSKESPIMTIKENVDIFPEAAANVNRNISINEIYHSQDKVVESQKLNTVSSTAIETNDVNVKVMVSKSVGSKDDHKSPNTNVQVYTASRDTDAQISENNGLINMKHNDMEQLNPDTCEPEVNVSEEVTGGIRVAELRGWCGKIPTIIALLTFIVLLTHTWSGSKNDTVNIVNDIHSESLLHTPCTLLGCFKLTDMQRSVKAIVCGLQVYRNALKKHTDDTDKLTVKSKKRNSVKKYGILNAQESLQNVILSEYKGAGTFADDAGLIGNQVKDSLNKSGNSRRMIDSFQHINKYGHAERRRVRPNNCVMVAHLNIINKFTQNNLLRLTKCSRHIMQAPTERHTTLILKLKHLPENTCYKIDSFGGPENVPLNF